MVDGLRVPGTWRHIVIHNDDYHLTNLIVYADGLINCWGMVTLEEFRAKVASGWVVTSELPAGARVSDFELGAWQHAEAVPLIGPDQLLAEVADEIERLAGRPTSLDRCRAAVKALRAEPTEQRREELRQAYEAVPEHLRRFLGDMDNHDNPYRVLAVPVGGRIGDSLVTAADHAAAFASFDRREVDEFADLARSSNERDLPTGSTTVVSLQVFRRGVPHPPGVESLQPEYPAAVEIHGRVYPTLHHAFWARSVAHPADHDRIVAEPKPYDAWKLALAVEGRADWHAVQLLEMGDLIRARVAQHPDLARALLDTGDGAIDFADAKSPYWGSRAFNGGRNWYGRLLELVRAELAAGRLG